MVILLNYHREWGGKLKNLAMFRAEKGIVQREMAELLGVSLSYYQKIEGGFKTPSYNFICRFKELYPEENLDIFFEDIITKSDKNKEEE